MRNRVKELRLEHGLTQQELADKVYVSSRTIISLEKQKYNPSVLLAYRIASVFDLSIEEAFIFDDGDK
ncbi:MULTISPECIES: helix-turn-helix transcriptional regulator [Romboutsia]|uniref:Helix-turn-helix n=1 Tax=Romboutsia hominis TaxID=1507512 RepID=A0A2P2BQ46_9FIRM|nr:MULTISPECIES: helix-turn-helix transcriptional regulator [Romboutsia]MCH1959786.1 helix-turn-helix transcriptional regulator [Romboutsia hominis]MCH1969790.1 helix-turn-helix transcriptional regulator [Romboutsia hominis]MDB8803719.1 helix-turn-helix transcriptional regulator [Romboutsia sp. 1001216sp1]MDB8806931.1 helix-turn-helix transcriptional regulator [Romboutsia sp. 1001216sp1]MDB8809366.1 helix-turn-helix transcriptional regulator [Romboutsia sp. 1001216sp1]